MRGVTWPQVVLTLGITFVFFAAVVILAALNQEVVTVIGAVVALFVTLMSVLGWRSQDRIDQKIDRVAEVSNGRLSEQIELNRLQREEIKSLHEQLTEMALRIPAEPQ